MLNWGRPGLIGDISTIYAFGPGAQFLYLNSVLWPNENAGASAPKGLLFKS